MRDKRIRQLLQQDECAVGCRNQQPIGITAEIRVFVRQPIRIDELPQTSHHFHDSLLIIVAQGKRCSMSDKSFPIAVPGQYKGIKRGQEWISLPLTFAASGPDATVGRYPPSAAISRVCSFRTKNARE
jgi:hypothetical protein